MNRIPVGSYFLLRRAQSSRNWLLFRVEAVNPDSPHDQSHQLALFLEGKFLHRVVELTQRPCDPVFIGHHPFPEGDFDFHFLKRPLQLVLLLRQILGGGKGFLAEMPRFRLAGEQEITGQRIAHFLPTLLKFGPAFFQRTQRAGFLLIGGGDGRLDEFRMATKLANDLEHEFIQGATRQVADGAGRSFALLADLVARVVKILPPMTVFFSARFRREAVAADPAMDDALE